MTHLEKLKAVPHDIRVWFGSDAVVESIIDIEKRFMLPENELTISKLIFRVETLDLPLEALESELALQLQVTAQTARSIYEEIKLKIFIPQAPALFSYGIGKEDLKGVAMPPAPVGPSLPTFSPSLPSASVPAVPMSFAPKPSSVSTTPETSAAPVPVSIYRDITSSQTTIKPSTGWGGLGSPVSSGNISSSMPSMVPAPNRAAHIDLGIPQANVDQKLKSIFVERETSKPQEVDYGAIPPKLPEQTAPVPTSSVSNPVTLDESVLPVAPAATPAPEAVEEPVGFLGSLMRKIAPRHSAKFGAARVATEEPSVVVDYSAEPVAPVPANTTGAVFMDTTPKPPAP